MHDHQLWTLVLAAVAFGGCLEGNAISQGPIVTKATAAASEQFLLAWDGYHRLGALDQLGHQRETEPLVERWEKVGTRFEIPPDVTGLEFNLTWTAEEPLHLMIHAPMRTDRSMPSYMGMGGEGSICVRVPTAELEGGIWEAMTHPSSSGPMDVPFTIRVWGESPSIARVLPGYHGHPLLEDWTMPMRQHDRCLVDLAVR